MRESRTYFDLWQLRARVVSGSIRTRSPLRPGRIREPTFLTEAALQSLPNDATFSYKNGGRSWGRRTELPFLFAADGEKVLASELCFARWDKYPVTEGHMLIIPNRHIADYFSVTAEEKAALWAMVDEGKKLLGECYKARRIQHRDQRRCVPDRPSCTATFISFLEDRGIARSTRWCARGDCRERPITRDTTIFNVPTQPFSPFGENVREASWC